MTESTSDLAPMETFESFPKFVINRAMWWPFMVVVGFFVMTEVGFWFLLVTGAVWLGIYFSRWKKAEAEGAVLMKINPLGFEGKTLALAILLSVIPAFFIAHAGPDHRAFYQDMPYQAARDMGYSHQQAQQMRPQVLMLVNEPKGLFRTAAGWFWFLSLSFLYGWRIYRFIFLRKFAVTKTPEHEHEEKSSTESVPLPEIVAPPKLEGQNYCVACGLVARSGDRYCGNCGHKH